jgi:hypothetical protein
VVSASGIENADSTAAFTLASSTPSGSGVAGRRSPIGQSCESASGRFGLIVFGVKLSLSLPSA